MQVNCFTNFPGLPLKIFSIYLEVGQVLSESTHPLGQTRPWVILSRSYLRRRRYVH